MREAGQEFDSAFDGVHESRITHSPTINHQPSAIHNQPSHGVFAASAGQASLARAAASTQGNSRGSLRTAACAGAVCRAARRPSRLAGAESIALPTRTANRHRRADGSSGAIGEPSLQSALYPPEGPETRASPRHHAVVARAATARKGVFNLQRLRSLAGLDFGEVQPSAFGQ